MDLFAFIATVVFVSVSGALAPGPLFFTNLTYGAKSGAKGGLIFSIGHMIVEFSLVMVLALGLLTLEKEPIVRLITGVAGGTALIAFGVWQIYSFARSSPQVQQKRVVMSSRNPLLVGLLFTALNPYFIFWWLVAGLPLIREAVAFAAIPGVFLMYAAHIWMDYAWLIGTAYLAKKGVNLIGSKEYRALMILFGALLIGFGFYFFAAPLFGIAG